MAEIGKSTRVVNKASVNILKALERARGSLADIPLGHKRVDPRTAKKHAQQGQPDPGVDTTLTRLLFEMRGKNQDAETLDPNSINTGDQQ